MDGQVERTKRTIEGATIQRFQDGGDDQLRTHLQLFVETTTVLAG